MSVYCVLCRESSRKEIMGCEKSLDVSIKILKSFVVLYIFSTWCISAARALCHRLPLSVSLPNASLGEICSATSSHVSKAEELGILRLERLDGLVVFDGILAGFQVRHFPTQSVSSPSPGIVVVQCSERAVPVRTIIPKAAEALDIIDEN